MRSHRSLTTRAAGLAAVALAAGALTGLAGTSAYAASGTSTYSCAFPVIGTLPVPMTGTIPDLPPLPAGTPIPAGSANMDMVFGIAPQLAGVLPSLTGLGITDMTLGGVPGGIPIQNTSFGSFDPVAMELPATGSNGAFTMPDAGSYPLTMPSSFDLVGSFAGNPISVPCTTDAPAALGTLTATDSAAPGDSVTSAKVAKKRILKNKRARVITTVAAVTPLPLPIPAQGDIKIKDRKKTVGTGSLDPTTGAVTIKTLKLKRLGKHVLKVRYAGSDLLNPSLDKVVVKVVKRR